MGLIHALLETEAFQVAPTGRVFWYTSGTVGPYYINTHYLYGSKHAAEQLLAFIDTAKEDRDDFADRLQERVERQYEGNAIYRQVIDALVERAKARGLAPDLVSGGERRDWFFSAAVARRLKVPHLLIYKNLECQVYRPGVAAEAAGDLADTQVLHVADLVTEASSYIRSWIPALAQKGGRIGLSLNVVDRAQGGLDVLTGAGVTGEALIRIDETFFAVLADQGRINPQQRDILVAYYRDPHAAMQRFLADNSAFIRDALAADERTAARARLLLEQNPYGLDTSRF